MPGSVPRVLLPWPFVLVACTGPDDRPASHPFLVATAADRDLLVERLDREPYASILAEIEEDAAGEWREPDPGHWDHHAFGRNADVAQANAMLAWLLDDEAAATKAAEFLAGLETGFETNDTWDVNIRMPSPLIGYTNTWDLLLGAGALSDAEAAEARLALTDITREFFDRYVEDPAFRGLALYPAQNNHPIRTAAAIGYVALAFPNHPQADEWADWALSELDYLWGPTGQYVQPDGGVSEGPFYYHFGLAPALAVFLAADNALPPDRVLHRDCRNRQTVEPWAGHGCVDGEAFTFDNPLHDERFSATVDWWIALALPWGNSPPLADAYFNPLNGGALLTGYGAGGHTRWSWETNRDRPMEMHSGLDLTLQHLVHLDDAVAPEEPPWTTRFLPEAGNAIFRSDWSDHAIWGLLVAESGPARMTLHDHADGTSFSVAAYGEYLLMDPGYYKPTDLENARTSSPEAHNVILIDGRGCPDKGLLTDFGDADAFLRNTWDGTRVDYAEAHQHYQGTDIVRGMALVRERWFLIADRLTTTHVEAREHAWRVSGYAGRSAGGLFEARADGASWEREQAGIDVYLTSTAGAVAVTEPACVEHEAPCVHQFELDRRVEHHALIDGAVDAVAPGFLAVLAPYRVDATDEDGPLVVEEVDLGEGLAAWRVVTGGEVDLAVLRAPDAPTELSVDGHTLRTDAELVVVGLAGDYALLARGTELWLDGDLLASGTGEVVVVE